MLIQLSPAKYEVQVATRCNAGLVSTVSPMINYEIGIAPKDSTADEIEDLLSYYNEDEETPEPAEYEEAEEEEGLDDLNTPFKIIIDTDALPDSLKANLPPGGSLPTLPQNPTIEQLKDAVKVKKTTCASVMLGYKCGNHDAASPPSGDDYQPQPGDELAMNSIKIEVVEIDAAGNGLGIAHIKGFNNAKLGVELKGIKVKEGGCIYAGQAITNSVDLALLTAKQKVALDKAYAIYNAALDKIEANAQGVAETINGFLDGLQKAKEKAQALSSKIAAGQTPTEAEVKTLAKLENQNLKIMTTAIDQLKKKYKDDINTEALALMEGYMADKRAAATALANYKPSMGPPPTAILQATANSQPELIEKTMKSVGPLQVEYNGIGYPTAKKVKTIKINPESLDGIVQGSSVIPLNCGFFLKNMVDGEPITWKLQTQTGEELSLEPPLRISVSATDAYMGIKWPDGQTKLKLTATSGSRSVSLNLEKPDWFVKDLETADGSRKAKAGETLYLVKTPAKDVKATLSWSSNLDPMLLKNHYFVNGNTTPNNLTTNKIPYTYSNSPSSTTYRLNALGYEKSVKVEVVDYKNSKLDYTQKIKSFWNILKGVEDVAKKVEPVMPCTVSFIDLNNKIQNKDFNFSYTELREEDPKSRHAKDIERYDFKLLGKDLAKFECSKNLGVKFWIVDLTIGEIYFNVGVSSDLSFRRDIGEIYETKEKIKPVSGLTGAMKLGTEIGGRLGNVWTLNKGTPAEIKVGVKATIAANAGGGFRVNYPYKNNFEELGGYFYIDPVKIKVTGEATAGIYSKTLSWDYPITGYWKGKNKIINFKTGFREEL